MNIYHIGLKDNVIQHSNFFKDAILVRSKTKTNIPTCDEFTKKNMDYNDLDNFIPICNYYDSMIEYVLSYDKTAKFMPYNQITIQHLKNVDKLICINDLPLIQQLNNKPEMRKLLKGIVTLLDYKYIQGKDINYENINKMFGKTNNNTQYVVQEFVGFAGIGTFILNPNNEKDILPNIKQDSYYSISEYIENNIPINNTFMISNNEILIFDGSCQNILMQNGLFYHGWDFEKYTTLDTKLRKRIYNQTLKIAKKLKKLGYIGIGGVDYILKDNNIYFMEINPRFQTSSEYLDKIIQERGFPSIFELQYLCFYDEKQFKYWKKIWNKTL